MKINGGNITLEMFCRLAERIIPAKNLIYACFSKATQTDQLTWGKNATKQLLVRVSNNKSVPH